MGERVAIDGDVRLLGQPREHKPEIVVRFQSGGFVKNARPARAAVLGSLALPWVAQADRVGEEHGEGLRLAASSWRPDAKRRARFFWLQAASRQLRAF